LMGTVDASEELDDLLLALQLQDAERCDDEQGARNADLASSSADRTTYEVASASGRELDEDLRLALALQSEETGLGSADLENADLRFALELQAELEEEASAPSSEGVRTRSPGVGPCMAGPKLAPSCASRERVGGSLGGINRGDCPRMSFAAFVRSESRPLGALRLECDPLAVAIRQEFLERRRTASPGAEPGVAPQRSCSHGRSVGASESEARWREVRCRADRLLAREIANGERRQRRRSPPVAPTAQVRQRAAADDTSARSHRGAASSSSSTAPQHCAICLEPLEGSRLNPGFGRTKAKWLPCSHGFHAFCIAAWLSARSTCPLCRTPMSGQAEALVV